MKPEPARVRAIRDGALAAVLVITGGVFFTRLDAVESVASIMRRFEGLELDDLLLTSALAVAAATWFALRRLQDSTRQLRSLRASEAEKARYVARLEELSVQLLDTEQRERARLAEALHDSVGQTLYACGLQLDRLSELAGEGAIKRGLHEARALASDAMAHTRDLTADLSPPILHDLGLCEAIEWSLQRLNERFDMQACFLPGDGWERIPRRWHEPVFHSVHELVVNAGKHAAAKRVEVSAETGRDGQVRVRVHDDGRGFPNAGRNSAGFGLFSIERRMACMGAELQIESEPARGTSATLLLPCGN